MAGVDVVDESFVYAPPERVAAYLADRRVLRRWFPGLDLEPVQDRGADGVRWAVTGVLVGTSEVWLEAWGPGTVLHYFLHADLARRGRPTEVRSGRPAALARKGSRAARRRQQAFKRAVWVLKDELEAGRAAGLPEVQSPAEAADH